MYNNIYLQDIYDKNLILYLKAQHIFRCALVMCNGLNIVDKIIYDKI